MEQRKEQRVHSVFEKISDQYDFMNNVISFKQHTIWRNDTMKRMNVAKGSRALDVCCGTADWTIALAEAVGETGHVTGLDFSKNMLAVGEKKVQHLKQVELRHGNAMELPFPDDTFDYVTIGFGLRNVPDYLQVVREMQRVVKPGGMVVCLETSQPSTVVKPFFNVYFSYIMPMLGKVLAKSYSEYSWLQESAGEFLNREQLKRLFEEAGLHNVMVKPYSFGAAALHIGYKQK
ncbi:menaquinone biosynthesis methyltransferase ubiE [Fictibacillus macauensis ZFHKF-1]|uniref:Demethylmenaquinone methyltransferase n=1 Tax=Fictibacillus macauensis ZFHKF-1 TaxID=1196324 RepID=I8AL46_9BACL|nr:demethylmenaquinone methyltransferase [Fictibacillus macauensis]EIT86587.1 menaquinone biosynthesis methyltransferase ubiE [Fictibacillus macauensis ZFHKF-1]